MSRLADPGPTLAPTVARLEAAFREIAATRMAGVPLCHPGLRVQAIGFEACADEPAAQGILLTPWFMNLVHLPLAGAQTQAQARAQADAQAQASMPVLAVGESRRRRVGAHVFEFIGAHEPALGSFEACSLFSPMAEFADQAAARATAEAVLAQLRAPVPVEAGAAPLVAATAPHAAPAPQAGPDSHAVPGPARRGFLFGRSR